MTTPPEYPEVTAWLRQRGASDDEISKILERVRQYEQRTLTDSMMDTIGKGEVDIAALIEAAMAEPDDPA